MLASIWQAEDSTQHVCLPIDGCKQHILRMPVQAAHLACKRMQTPMRQHDTPDAHCCACSAKTEELLNAKLTKAQGILNLADLCKKYEMDYEHLATRRADADSAEYPGGRVSRTRSTFNEIVSVRAPATCQMHQLKLSTVFTAHHTCCRQVLVHAGGD